MKAIKEHKMMTLKEYINESLDNLRDDKNR